MSHLLFWYICLCIFLIIPKNMTQTYKCLVSSVHWMCVYDPKSAWAHLDQTQVSHISSSPWAALDLNTLSLRRWAEAGLPPGFPPPRTLCRLPACLSAKKRQKKNMSRYFYCSALWSSHRLLKQSPLINIYSLSDGTGSMERGEREERVSLNNHHPSTSSPLSSLRLSEVEVMF